MRIEPSKNRCRVFPTSNVERLLNTKHQVCMQWIKVADTPTTMWNSNYKKLVLIIQPGMDRFLSFQKDQCCKQYEASVLHHDSLYKKLILPVSGTHLQPLNPSPQTHLCRSIQSSPLLHSNVNKLLRNPKYIFIFIFIFNCSVQECYLFWWKWSSLNPYIAARKAT